MPVRIRRRHLPERNWGGFYENVAVMVAIGVNEDGYREIIGCAEGFTESKKCPRDFLSWLKSRGLQGVLMVVGDKAAGMVDSIVEVFPNVRYQRCTVHFYRNALAKAPDSSAPRSRLYSRPSMPWNRARPRRPKPSRWQPSSSR